MRDGAKDQRRDTDREDQMSQRRPRRVAKTQEQEGSHENDDGR